jgi:hypothetical protein
MIGSTITSKTDVERLSAVLRMIAYSIEEAKDLDADLLKYTLEVAFSAGAELIKQRQIELSYETSPAKDKSIFVPIGI